MDWTVVVKHGEAVAEMPERLVALDVSQPYRPRLWAYDYRPGRDFLEAVWVQDEAWRTDPRFAGIEAVLKEMLKMHPGLSGHARQKNLDAIHRRAAAA